MDRRDLNDLCAQVRFSAVVPMEDFMIAPNQYQLLHHAAAFARQLEAAGLPEAETTRDTDEEGNDTMYFGWPKREADYAIVAHVIGTDTWCEWSIGVESQEGFTLGDPLPDALVQAIKETAWTRLQMIRRKHCKRAWLHSAKSLTRVGERLAAQSHASVPRMTPPTEPPRLPDESGSRQQPGQDQSAGHHHRVRQSPRDDLGSAHPPPNAPEPATPLMGQDTPVTVVVETLPGNAVAWHKNADGNWWTNRVVALRYEPMLLDEIVRLRAELAAVKAKDDEWEAKWSALVSYERLTWQEAQAIEQAALRAPTGAEPPESA